MNHPRFLYQFMEDRLIYFQMGMDLIRKEASIYMEENLIYLQEMKQKLVLNIPRNLHYLIRLLFVSALRQIRIFMKKF